MAKFSPQGKQMYLTQVRAVPSAVASGSDESAYVTGTADADLQASAGAFQATVGNASCPSDPLLTSTCHNAFVVKLNPDGSTAYATFLGGGGNDAGAGIAVDVQGSVYLTGQTQSVDFPVTAGAMQPVNGAANAPHAFVARLDPTGSKLIFSTYLGGSGFDTAASVAIDVDGSVFIVGSTNSTDFPVTANAYQLSYGGGPPSSSSNAFYAKLDALGNAQFASYLGGLGTETGVSLAFQPGGPLYIGVAGPLQALLAPQRAVCSAQSTVVMIDPASGAVKDFNDLPGVLVGPFYLAVEPGGVVDASGFVKGSTLFVDHDWDSLLRIDFTRQNVFVPACVVDTASGQPISGMGLGEMISIYGTGIGPVVPAWAAPGASYPTQLSGVQISYNGTPMPLLYVSESRVDAVVPYDFGQSNGSLAFGYGSYEASSSFGLGGFLPCLFVRDSSRQAKALNEDGTPNSPENPAEPGSVVSLFASGLGTLIPVLATSNPDDFTALSVHCCYSVLTVVPSTPPLPIQYEGFAPGEPPGVYQINTQLPQTAASGQIPIYLAVYSYLCGSRCLIGDQPTTSWYDSNIAYISVK